MRYFKMLVYVQGEDYETRERLIDETTFRKYQKAIAEGMTHLILEDRVIKVSSIKEILPADDIVAEHARMGLPLTQLGLPENPKLQAKSSWIDEGLKKLGDAFPKITKSN